MTRARDDAEKHKAAASTPRRNSKAPFALMSPTEFLGRAEPKSSASSETQLLLPAMFQVSVSKTGPHIVLLFFALFYELEYNPPCSYSLEFTKKSSPMPFEKFEDAAAIDIARRKAIAKSIRIISVEELKKLGEEMFDYPDRPWRETFFQCHRKSGWHFSPRIRRRRRHYCLLPR